MRVIKKYPNRRLYDTEKSSYITLAEVHKIIKSGKDFKVVDADSGEDITRSILVQIIIDQENGETPIFTTDMLTKFIRFYDDAAQNLFGEFLEKNMQMFTEQQKKFQEQMVGGIIDNPVTRIVQETTERNLMFWQDMQQKFLDIATAGIRNPAPPATEDDEPKSKKKRK
ncbi:MAG: polyhydroxyalkonate synthesis repressor, PhaR [Alphaproteobacteria bacterium]|jgi:polyhydroxyalkanoate synthesis repressor PhaR|nr:polyhydroxyalkonate synthesis repressor, PhaR [Alphaproteobacteria bacterium]